MASSPSGSEPAPPNDKPAGSFTGIRRERKTKLSIKIGDTVAKSLITVGGLGTIAAVSLVCVFLISKVGPLFKSGKAEPMMVENQSADATTDQRVVEPLALQADTILEVLTDEYRVMTAMIDDTGTVRTYRVDNGELLSEQKPFGDQVPTAWCLTPGSEKAAAGFGDGSVRFGTIEYGQTFLTPDQISPELEALQLEQGELASYQGGVVQRTPRGQLRLQSLRFKFGDPAKIADKPIISLDHSAEDDEYKLVAVTEDQKAYVAEVEFGFMGAKIKSKPLPVELDSPLMFAGLSGLGNNVWLVLETGRFVRVDVRSLNRIALADDFNATDGAKVTAATFLIGKSTLLIGDENGHVGAWFTYAASAGDENIPIDNLHIVEGHSIQNRNSAVTDIAVSKRTRMAVIGYADGFVSINNTTNEGEVLSFDALDGVAPEIVELTPKDNGLLIVANKQANLWELDVEHHAVTASSLIFPIHYESKAEKETVWQSSSGDDAAEPKYSMWPVVFGSIKATFYAMIFGVPIALLAAIYTSEFLNPKIKATVKPVIEMMASLPSVVLGFLAGLVVAAWVEPRIMTVVLSIITVPIAMLLCARIWQFVPRSTALRVGPWRLLLMGLAIPLGVVFAMILAGPTEWLFFTVKQVDPATGAVLVDSSGAERVTHDLKQWLSAGEQPVGDAGFLFESSAAGGWMFLFLPLAGLVSMLINGRYVTPWLRAWGKGHSEGKMAGLDLIRFLVSILVTFIVALILSQIAGPVLGDLRTSTFIGWFVLMLPLGALAVRLLLMMVPGLQSKSDEGVTLNRILVLAGATAVIAYIAAAIVYGLLGELGSPVGKYDQRNALIVGFMMGFAIIPIIYTIAEDALSSVPTHLRSASLGCGATPWQTAIRVILPTGMSGVFSAIMIGLGRAVGETMIVLMATGNTPVTSLNVFNGFRTLAATIAVELPEAPQDGTLYRTLFLCGLVLFVMTFALNTVAEAIRQRFRKRAFEL